MHSDEVIATPTDRRTRTVALIGNPNSGKSSTFNRLTGLRQKVGNFPGVTVERKTGRGRLSDLEVNYIDFPGAYSLYPTSQDERIVVQSLLDPEDPNYPDAVLYVADATRLDKHLLLFTQLYDLGLPLILVLNMADQAEREGLAVDLDYLGRELRAPVVLVSSRTGAGFDRLEQALADLLRRPEAYQAPRQLYPFSPQEEKFVAALRPHLPAWNDYHLLLLGHHGGWLPHLDEATERAIRQARLETGYHSLRGQVDETLTRYDIFTPMVQKAQKVKGQRSTITERLDGILTHRVFGPVIFLLLMLLVFQALYAWAAVPMDAIEGFFAFTGETARTYLPEGWLTDLFVDGILAGLGGILVFAPQIAILFFLIGILEEIGYMARAAFMFDRLMQSFGLNGRSLVSLISGHACAIPAIMSTRTIADWKERLLTILVTPMTSCSARIPVYTILIGFAVADRTVWGIFNLQGLAFMGLYLLGILGALLSALLFKLILKSRERSFLMLEMPDYRTPVWRNIWLNVYEKVKTFVVEAGRVIIVISIILWGLANFGPGQEMARAADQARTEAAAQDLDVEAAEALVASAQLENSYAGHIGRFMEPAIEPLGYDWKIGIALLTSFAAREVFVGTMATIYSIGDTEDEFRIRARLAAERDPVTGEPVYDPATAWSLLIFYVFAMMCMSTLAVTKRETNSWKWPIIQFVFMTGVAYLGALGVYQWLA